MATNKRQVLIRVEPQNYDKFKAIADKNRRSVSNQLEYLMEIFIKKYESQNGSLIVDAGQKSSAIINNQVGDNDLQVTSV